MSDGISETVARLTAISNGEEDAGYGFDPLSQVIVNITDLRTLLAAYEAASAALAIYSMVKQMHDEERQRADRYRAALRAILAHWDAMDAVPANDETPTEVHRDAFDAVLNAGRELLTEDA
jgi:hypothetical protein